MSFCICTTIHKKVCRCLNSFFSAPGRHSTACSGCIYFALLFTMGLMIVLRGLACNSLPNFVLGIVIFHSTPQLSFHHKLAEKRTRTVIPNSTRNKDKILAMLLLQTTDTETTDHFRPMFSILSSFQVKSTDRSAVKLPWHVRATTFDVLVVDSISESKGNAVFGEMIHTNFRMFFLKQPGSLGPDCSPWFGSTTSRSIDCRTTSAKLLRSFHVAKSIRDQSRRESQKLLQTLPERVVQSTHAILPIKQGVYRGYSFSIPFSNRRRG